MCCFQEVKCSGQGSRMLGILKGDMTCDSLEKEMELVVWELW